MPESPSEQALRHVLSGRRIIAAQQIRIAQLREAGRDSTFAEKLLEQYERTQALFEDDLRRLEEK